MPTYSNYGPLIEGLFERVHRRSVNPPDRRPRSRPMEVLAVGMSRTGTESLAAALVELGYNETYHGWKSVEQPMDYFYWRQASAASFESKGKLTTDDWDKLLGNCAAVTDAHCALFWRELIEAYPEAKVILTERDTESWHRSISSTFLVPMGMPFLLFMWHFQCELWYNLAFPDMIGFFMHGDPKFLKRAYVEHNETIKATVPKDRLLVYHASQGWEPLCKFLGKEIPKREMPRGNNPAAFAARFQEMTTPRSKIAMRNMVIVLSLLVAVLAITGRLVALLIQGLGAFR